MITFAPQTILGYRKDGRPIRVIAGGDPKVTPSPSPQTLGSPSPSPQAQPLTADQQIQQADEQALNGTGSTSTADLYGLGQWKDQTINPSGFPPAITLLLQQAGIDTSQPITGAQLAQAIATVKNPALVSQIQQMLFFAGAYGTSVKSFTDLQNGTFGAPDVKALASMITSAGQTGAAFGTYLTSAANYGKANGILSAAQSTVQKPITVPNPSDENAVLKAEAHTLFGHDPSPDEYARFQAYFNTKVTQATTAAANAATAQIAGLPDAASLGTAIGDLPASQSQFGGNLATPPTTLTSQGESATAAEHDMLAARSAVTGTGYNPAAPNVGAQYQNSSQYANPAYSAFTAQQTRDQQALAAVNGAAPGGPATITAAPDMSAAADAFLQQDNPGAIGAQSDATRYRTLLSILGGAG